ncbi:MAG: glycosyltransferase family 2 protein [Candidatus Nanoarchaeia archaeon]|nr:glycosyltransferase family 2 protein [Candidatus Nanoarchaeia archaeon]
MKLSVIMPAYNEKNTILEILEKIKKIKLDKEIIIVDDFSSDGTREILNALDKNNIKIIFHEKNYGKGNAIRTALKYASGDIIIIQDADLEYNPEDYYSLIKPILAKESKVVYGTRFPKEKRKISRFKNKYFLGNMILTVVANILYNAKITDEATCYKVFDAELLKSINLKCRRFEFCPEVTAKLRKLNERIIEVPVRYFPRGENEGKKIRYKDGFEALWTLLKYRFVN